MFAKIIVKHIVGSMAWRVVLVPCAKSAVSSMPWVGAAVKVELLQMAVDTRGCCVIEKDSTAMLRVSPATQNSGSSSSFHDERVDERECGISGSERAGR